MAGGGAAKVGLFGCGSEMSFFLYRKKIIMNLDSENYFFNCALYEKYLFPYFNFSIWKV